MWKFFKTILFFTLVVSITILILIFIQPYLYRVLPSDYKRHVVLENYFNKNNKGEIIIFGASETMFGVDSRIIIKELNISGEAYNLSSVAQSLYEASYYYTRVKNNTKIILQNSTPAFFSKNRKRAIAKETAISMYLSGYRISNATKKLIPDYNKFFDNSELHNYYESRTMFRSYIHNLIRPLFDNEITDKTKGLELYFPNPFINKKHPNYPVYEYDCDFYRYKNKPVDQIKFIKRAVTYFNKRNIKYVIVLMPVNPDNCSECYDDFNKYAEELKKIENLYVINITNILTPEYFYDGYHANREGAKIISKEISNKIKILNLDNDLK